LFSKIKCKEKFLLSFYFSKRILLDHKETNVNHRNDQGGTALHFASAGEYSYERQNKNK